MKTKSFSKQSKNIIKEHASFYAKQFSHGVYYIEKNRHGGYDYFITVGELVKELNSINGIVAVESGDEVHLHCYDNKEKFEYITNLVDQYNKSLIIRRDSQLDGMLG